MSVIAPTCWLLVRRIGRKHRALLAAVVLLSLVVGLLANTAAVMTTQYGAYMVAKAGQWRTPDNVAVMPRGQGARSIAASLAGDPRVRQVETDRAVTIRGSIPYGDGTLPSTFLFYDAGRTPELGRWEVHSQLTGPVDNPVWVPLTLQAAGGYELGDELVLTTALGRERFHIQGFVEATFGGMPALGIVWLGLPSGSFAQLDAQARQYLADLAAHNPQAAAGQDARQVPGWMPSILLKATYQDPQDDDRLLSDLLADQGLRAWDMSRTQVTGFNQLSVGIVSAVVLLFSTMIAALAVIVLGFMVRTGLEDDRAGHGILRAMGYTHAQVAGPMTLAFTLGSGIGATAGAAGSYAVLPYLALVLRAQTGTTWHARLAPWLLVACVAAMTGLMAATVALATRRVRRLSTVSALRGGTTDHAARPSRIHLGRVPGSLNLVLGLKAMASARRRTAVVLLVATVCTLVAAVSASGLGTLSRKDSAVDLLLGGTVEEVSVRAPAPEDVDRAAQEAQSLPGVQRVVRYDRRGQNLDGRSVMLLVLADAGSLPTNPVYEGRTARHGNEVVLGPTLARALDLEVGDVWTVTDADGTHDLLVTGLASGVLSGGSFAIVTPEAYRGLYPKDPPLTGLAVFLSDSAGSAAATRELQGRLGSGYEVVDMRASMLVQVGSYTTLVPALSIVLLTFTALAVVLVVWLVTATAVARSRHGSAVLKALGMTSREAGARVAWSILPPLALGTLAGCLLGLATVHDLLAWLLSSVGVMQMTVDLPRWPVAVVGALTLVTAFVAVQATTRPLRRVSARELLNE